MMSMTMMRTRVKVSVGEHHLTHDEHHELDGKMKRMTVRTRLRKRTGPKRRERKGKRRRTKDNEVREKWESGAISYNAKEKNEI